MIEWTNGNSEKKWVEMQNTISRTTFHKNIWIPRKFRMIDSETHKLTKNVFKIWGHWKNEWIYNSPLMALTGTHFFYTGE